MQVNPAEVDKLLWKATKEGLYMVRSNVGLWKGKKCFYAPSKSCLESDYSHKSRLFCIGVLVGRDNDFGST